MGFVTSELDAMRAAVNELLPGTCHVLSVTRTADGQGGFTESWGTATANVKCRLDNITTPGSRGEKIAGMSVQPFRHYVLTVPYDTTLTEQHRVKIGSDSYAVVGIDTAKSAAVSKRAFVEAV